MRFQSLVFFAVAVWSLAIGAGLVSVWTYAHTPGASRPTPAFWPAATGIERSAQTWTLVLAVHPRCSCSRATYVELDQVLRDTVTPIKIIALVYRSPDEPSAELACPVGSWLAGRPLAELIDDISGAHALQFGLATSGEIALYDPHGSLAFSGGITGSRGHEGDNPGAQKLRAVLTQTVDSGTFPVFGCPLESPVDQNRENPLCR